MKNFKVSVLLMAAAVMLLGLAGLPAFGQGASLDSFGAVRTVAVTPAQVIKATTTNTVDISMFKGIGQLDLTCFTNNGATMTATIYTSPDNTNYTLVSYALATSTTFNYTNHTYGTTNLIGTNTFLLPGTLTTPTAATAGWATQYLLSAPFTNTAAITTTAGGTWSLGIPLDDCNRYLHVVWTYGGSQFAVCSATLIGRANFVP